MAKMAQVPVCGLQVVMVWCIHQMEVVLGQLFLQAQLVV